MSIPGGGNWEFSTGAALMGHLERAHVGAREKMCHREGAFSFINSILTILSLGFESRSSPLTAAFRVCHPLGCAVSVPISAGVLL